MQWLILAFLVPRAVPDAQDQNGVAFYAIAQDVRPHDRHLAPSSVGSAASLREFGEAVGERDQPLREALGGGGIID